MVKKKPLIASVSKGGRSRSQSRTTSNFQACVLSYYKKAGRKFPWRETNDPYQILISEVMLQQTQTARVLQYYPLFLKRFPNVRALARSSLAELLELWAGLGYNRRARALRECAKNIVTRHGARIPQKFEELIELPGIGEYTAGAIQAFAFELPAVIVETNIRAVFLHHFFKDAHRVDDKEIRALIQKTLYIKDPRRWYYALMDYGVFLKTMNPKINHRSARYRRQSPFEGSVRQERGRILKLLVTKRNLSFKGIMQGTTRTARQMQQLLLALEQEGFTLRRGDRFILAK